MKKLLFFACSLLLMACGGDDAGGGNTPSGGSEYLNVSDVNIPGGNTTATLNIQASQNCEWVINWSDSWIRNITPTKGRGSQNATVTVSVNPSSDSNRTAVIIVSNTSGTITRNITVTQSASSESLEISPQTMNFTYAASNQDVTVTSNTHWSITGTASWFSINRTEGDDNGVVKISVNENTTETERNAVLTFKGTSISQQLTIHQAGRSTDFSVSPTNITAEATTSTVQISIAGDAQWTAQSNQDWATLSDISGEGSKSITVTLGDNTTEEQRMAQITINSSTKTEMVTINQKAATRPVVTDLHVSGVTRNEANVAFSYSSIFSVSEYGVCYSTNAEPTISGTHISELGASLQASYSSTLTDLTPGTTYHLRAYAISVVGIVYSEDITFTTAQGDKPNAGDNPQPGW